MEFECGFMVRETPGNFSCSELVHLEVQHLESLPVDLWLKNQLSLTKFSDIPSQFFVFFSTVAVLGAGLMGAGIAQVS